MQDFEKVGAFYLGRRHDPAANRTSDEIVLYDSKDLTTHAVIIGMTGSGKTGLGIGLIEEAALDHIPVIAIDPKGDLGNLLLSFPKLKPDDFEPWIDARAAAEAGEDAKTFAASTAALWKKGLADWGQTPARIESLRKAAEFAIYTPGSSAGVPLCVLGELSAPSEALRAEPDLFRERILATVNGLLALLRIDADPVASREHVLLSNVLERVWAEGRSLDLAGLIAAITSPAFDRIGVMDLETFYPARDRFALSMRLNSLLAAPGFDVWMQGDPLSAARLLYAPSGKPRVSVLSIAHLDEAARMFFVTMLLNEVIAWMRRQPGSASLRAIVYMDEIAGYLPPVANPPSKALFLTLLKQARAYGVGLVLATQNPVDLDYKGLSNAGTWFIGRLQTERDKARVREGLEGAAGSDRLDQKTLEATLSGLGKRRFLLHNVHEQAPVIFATRRVMSYLAGPLTRDQIKRLSADRSASQSAAAARAPVEVTGEVSMVKPALPPAIRQFYLPHDHLPDAPHRLVYCPRVLAFASVCYTNARVGVDEQHDLMLTAESGDGPAGPDWERAETLDLAPADLDSRPDPDAGFAAVPAPMAQAKSYTTWERGLRTWLRASRPLTLYRSARFKVYSKPGETEGDFRARLQLFANGKRDVDVGRLRKRYESKVARLRERLRRAEQAVDREAEQARGAKVDTAISFGTAVLGALLGRKSVSVTSASRVGTAMRRAGGASKQAGDVRGARETVEAVRAELEVLEAEFDAEVDALDDACDAQDEALEEIPVRPKHADIDVRFVGIGWEPLPEPRH